MVAGSFASTFHGEPRMTRDIDLVIDPTREAMAKFIGSLDDERFYKPDWVDELDRRGMVNVIDMSTGWKVDLIFKKDRAFSNAEFERRQRVLLGGIPVFVASAEDTILSKLEWAKISASDRQIADVRAILKTQAIDEQYLSYWADELGVTQLLAEVSA